MPPEGSCFAPISRISWCFMSRGPWVNGSQCVHFYLGGGFKYFLFSPLLGEDFHFDQFFVEWVETTNQLLQQGSIGKEAMLSTSVSRVNELSFLEKKGSKAPCMLPKIDEVLSGGFLFEICLFMFNPYLGDMIQFDEHIFVQMG